MKSDKITRFSDLKIGECFQHEKDGPVWIKCRGGFRLGRGGSLHACASHVQIIRYDPAYAIAKTGESVPLFLKPQAA